MVRDSIDQQETRKIKKGAGCQGHGLTRTVPDHVRHFPLLEDDCSEAAERREQEKKGVKNGEER